MNAYFRGCCSVDNFSVSIDRVVWLLGEKRIFSQRRKNKRKLIRSLMGSETAFWSKDFVRSLTAREILLYCISSISKPIITKYLRRKGKMKFKPYLFTILITIVLIVSACGGGTTPTQTAAPEQPTAVTAPTNTPETMAQPTEEPATTAPTMAPEVTQPPAAEERSGGVLRFGLRAADLGNLNPSFATSTQDRTIVDMIFNGLLRQVPGDASQFEPDLAVDFPTVEMSGDAQVWTFQLRQGVMCQPSEGVESYELTSDDVLYSFEQAANADTSAFAAEYTGATFEAPDASTFKMTLDTPLSEALFYPKVSNYGGGFIVCKQAYENMSADDAKTHPVGTGPFMFKSYTPQVNVELVAFENYFRGNPQLDGVNLSYIADLTSLELGLRSGELDVINGGPDSAWVSKMETVPDINVDVFGVGEVAIVYFNTAAPPLDNLEVRQALAYALDRQEFLALAGDPVAEIVYSPVPVKFLPGGLTEEEVAAQDLLYEYNPDTAIQMLSDAGYPDGFSMDLVTSELTGYKAMYESMQAQLSKVGVTINLTVVDHSSYHSLIREDTNPIVIYIAWRPNADVYLTRFFLSDSIVVTGSTPDTNFSHYDKIDDLILQARSADNQDTQIELWKEAQIQILSDMAAYPLQYQNQVYARQSYVDYGHPLISELALYPGITENTRLNK
jgi:peptide/nickel transport system substrate-binding protein